MNCVQIVRMNCVLILCMDCVQKFLQRLFNIFGQTAYSRNEVQFATSPSYGYRA
jgi:hypothetical protein